MPLVLQDIEDDEFDEIHKAKHYNSHPSGVEAIDICREYGFDLGNAIKYMMRAWEKGYLWKDINKCRYYIWDFMCNPAANNFKPSDRARQLLHQVMTSEGGPACNPFRFYMAIYQMKIGNALAVLDQMLAEYVEEGRELDELYDRGEIREQEAAAQAQKLRVTRDTAIGKLLMHHGVDVPAADETEAGPDQ